MAHAMKEVERKFLVNNLPDDLTIARTRRIEQGYVAVDGATEVRVRQVDDRCLLTVKSGPGMIRTEIELEIPEPHFKALWTLCEGRRLTKIRHDIPFAPHLIEVDAYAGPLDGLIVAEVEFESPEEAWSFTPPGWFGREITEDLAFKNAALAKLDSPPPH